MNFRLWLLGLALSPLIALFWKRVRTGIFGSRRVIPTGSQSIFAVARNKTVEILLGDGARAAHKGQFGIRLKRLAYVYLWRKMAAGMRVTNAESAAEVRRLETVVKPPGLWETICRAFDRFCRESLNFARNRWYGLNQWRQNCWRSIRAWHRARRIERRPITEAVAERRRNRNAEAGQAIRDGVARWRVWLRNLPIIGRWFGSNHQQTAEERQRSEQRENSKLYMAIGVVVLLASLIQLGATIGTAACLLYAYGIILSLRLIVAGKSNYTGTRRLYTILLWKTSTFVGVITALVWYRT